MGRKKRTDAEDIEKEAENLRARASLLEGQKADLMERGEEISKELDYEEQKNQEMGLGFQDFDKKVTELEKQENAGEKPGADSEEKEKKEEPTKKPKPDTRHPQEGSAKPGKKKGDEKPRISGSKPGPVSAAKSEDLRKKLEEQKSLIESLENEKKSLAKIIEQISRQEESPAPSGSRESGDADEKLVSRFEQKFDELEEKLEEKLEKKTAPAGAGGKKEVEGMAGEEKKTESPEAKEGKDASEPRADAKKISSMIKKVVDSRFDEISEKLKGLDRIAALAETMRPSSLPAAGSPKPVPAGHEEPSVLGAMAQMSLPHPSMEGSSVSTGLASFGQEINFHEELLELKKQIDFLKKNIDTLSKKWDYSLGNLEDRVRELDKLPVLEKNYQELVEKLGSENVQRLKRLVFNADELTDEVIPDIINKKFRYRLDPLVTSLKNTRGAVKELSSKVNILRSEIRDLSRMRDTLNEFRLEKDRLYKRFAEEEAKFLDGLQILKDNIKKKMDKLAEKMNRDMQSLKEASDYATIESNVKDIVTVLFEKRFQELERNQAFFEQKSNDLEEHDTRLRKMIEEMEAPESIKRWAETRLQEIEKKITPDIENAKKDIARQADGLNSLREGLKLAERTLNRFSKRIDEHTAALSKLIDSKDLFFKRADELAGRMGVLEEKVYAEAERLSSAESSLQTALKDYNTRIGKAESLISELEKRAEKGDSAISSLAKSITHDIRKEIDAAMLSVRNSTSAMQSKLLELKSDTGAEIKALKSITEPLSKKTESHSNLLIKLMESGDTLDKRTEDLGKEIKDLNNRLTSESDRISSAEQSLARNFSAELADMRKMFNARLAEVSKSSMKDLKGQIGRISVIEESLKTKEAELREVLKEIDSVRSIISELPSIRKRLDSIERRETDFSKISEKYVSDDEFIQTIRTISARIEGVEKKTEDALKNLSERSGSLREMIVQSLGDEKVMKSAQESLKNLFSDKLNSIDARLSADVKTLKKALEGTRTEISSLRSSAASAENSLKELAGRQDKSEAGLSRLVDSFRSLKNIPAKLDSQEKVISGLIEDRNALAARADILASEMENLKEQLSGETEKLTDIERKMLQALAAKSDALKKDMESRVSDILKSQLRGFEQDSRRIIETEEELKSFISSQRSEMSRLNRDLSLLQKSVSEMETLKTRVSDLEAGEKELHEKTVQNQLLSGKVSGLEKLMQAVQEKQSALEEQIRADRLKYRAATREYEREKKELTERLNKEKSRISELLKELRE